MKQKTMLDYIKSSTSSTSFLCGRWGREGTVAYQKFLVVWKGFVHV